MAELDVHHKNLADDGFTIISKVFSVDEVDAIVTQLAAIKANNKNFRQSADLFAIRRFLHEVPQLVPLVFNERLKQLINELFCPDYFVVKSIYFDKPGKSNWFVAYHQDLTIAVNRKAQLPGYGPWTVKGDQFAVQPPVAILKDNFTIRIHLDDTDEDNGALKVIPASHKAINRPENINKEIQTEVSCNVPAGGIMIMKPLLLHASNRTVNDKNRRVMHIEFSRSQLAEGIDWAEKMEIAGALVL